MTLKPIRIEDMDDTQRQVFADITNVVPFEIPEATAARVRECMTSVTALMRAYAQAASQAAEALGRTVQAMREAGLIDDTGKPDRRRDRPAHQSPYRPAHQRRT